MLNITLTIAAAPELLAALSNFTNSITSTKVVTVSKSTPEYTSSKADLEQSDAEVTYNQLAPISMPVNVVQAHQQATVQTPAAQTTAVPTSTQTYTMELLAVAATRLVDAGRRSELVSLLQTFGVQALTALPKEHYGAFATQLRALGAKL
jgi:cytoskeletal protein RodZ